MLNFINNRIQQRMNHIIQQPAFAMLSRIIAAIVGGYVLSNLIAILLSYLLSTVWISTTADGVMIAMQLSYLIYAVIAMWIFSGKPLAHVWRTLTFSCLFSAFLIGIFMPEGLL
ncbi:MAG: hypothetical protein HRT53_15740 [Colwellia sp.]|nr:hypothetical protein [Colwellia sp.]